MKRYFIISLVAVSILFTGCNSAKKNLATNIIKSYALAIKENDEKMQQKLFRDILLFNGEFPKSNTLFINKMEVVNKFIMVHCFLENDNVKKTDQELIFKINSADSTIIDVLGYLQRKTRNEIIDFWQFKIFTDIKGTVDDMDATLLRKQKKAMSRFEGYDYYAAKSIIDKSEVTFNIKQGKYDSFYSGAATITLSIKNNSDTILEYSFYSGDTEYKFEFPAFEPNHKSSTYSVEGVFKVKAGETLNQTTTVKGVFILPLNKKYIHIKPYLASNHLEDNMKLVLKFCDKKTIESITNGTWDMFTFQKGYQLEFKID